MSSPTRGSQTSTSQIEVVWTALTAPNNGYSSILSYHLQWDNGVGNFASPIDLIGNSIDSLVLNYIVSSSIVSGSSYLFRVRAKNYWGWGDFSTSVSIKASTSPSKMDAVTTSIDGTTGGVKIQWTAPNSNADTITSYLIEIYDPITLDWHTNSNCDGT